MGRNSTKRPSKPPPKGKKSSTQSSTQSKDSSTHQSKDSSTPLLVEDKMKTQSTINSTNTNSTPLLPPASPLIEGVPAHPSPAPAPASSIAVATDSVSRARRSNATSNATSNTTSNTNDNSPTQRSSAFSDNQRTSAFGENPFAEDNPFGSSYIGNDSDRLDHIANSAINSGTSGGVTVSELAPSGNQNLADSLRLQNLEALVRSSTGPSSSRFSSPQLLRFGPSLSAQGPSQALSARGPSQTLSAREPPVSARGVSLSARFDSGNTDFSSGLNKLNLLDSQNLLDNQNDQTADNQTTTNGTTNGTTNATANATTNATANATTKSATTSATANTTTNVSLAEKSPTAKTSATTNAPLAERSAGNSAEKSKLEEILALEEEIRKTDVYEKDLEKDIEKIHKEEEELEETLVNHVMHGPHGGVMGAMTSHGELHGEAAFAAGAKKHLRTQNTLLQEIDKDKQLEEEEKKLIKEAEKLQKKRKRELRKLKKEMMERGKKRIDYRNEMAGSFADISVSETSSPSEDGDKFGDKFNDNNSTAETVTSDNLSVESFKGEKRKHRIEVLSHSGSVQLGKHIMSGIERISGALSFRGTPPPREISPTWRPTPLPSMTMPSMAMPTMPAMPTMAMPIPSHKSINNNDNNNKALPLSNNNNNNKNNRATRANRREFLQNYFSSKVVPGLYDETFVRSGFGEWNRQSGLESLRKQLDGKHKSSMESLRERLESQYNKQVDLRESEIQEERQKKLEEFQKEREELEERLTKKFSWEIKVERDEHAIDVEKYRIQLELERQKAEMGLKNSKKEIEELRNAEEKEREMEREIREKEERMLREKEEEQRKRDEQRQREQREENQERERRRRKKEHDQRITLLEVSEKIHEKFTQKEMFRYWKEGVIESMEEKMHKSRELQHQETVNEITGKLEEVNDEFYYYRQKWNSHKKNYYKMKGDLIVKCFSEKICPAVYEKARTKAAFFSWREDLKDLTFGSVLLEKDEAMNTILTQKDAEYAVTITRKDEELKHAMSTVLDQHAVVLQTKDAELKTVLDQHAVVLQAIDAEHAAVLQIKNDELTQKDAELNSVINSRDLEVKTRELLLQSKKDLVVKLFAEKVCPELHDTAAKKEVFNSWNELFIHSEYMHRGTRLKSLMEEEVEHRKTQKLHSSARSDVMVKYFAERVAPGVHDVAGKKEAFGMWNEEYIHSQYAKKEAEAEKREGEIADFIASEHAKTHKIHNKTRSDMMVKFFSENVSPAVHDVAMKKEGFGVWKEEVVHFTYKQEMEKLMQLQLDVNDHKIHTKTRSDLMVKYFSENISPAVHDVTMKKEGFGLWKEEYVHDTYKKEMERVKELHISERLAQEYSPQKLHDDAREREYEEAMATSLRDVQRKLDEAMLFEQDCERKLRQKTRGEMMVKYFSERVAPAVHDVGMKKEGFGVWKEDYTETIGKLELQRRQSEAQFILQSHQQTRSDMIVKYFSEKISPAVHDLALKKEGFGVWNEEFLRHNLLCKYEKMWEKQDEKYSDALGEKEQIHSQALEKIQKALEARDLHIREKKEAVSKYFSEKVAPTVHYDAVLREGFHTWKEECVQEFIVWNDEQIREEMGSEMRREQARIREEHKLTQKSRGEMVIKYFAEKICPVFP